jgi:hypothetical protein
VPQGSAGPVKTGLSMAPRFDKNENKWIPLGPEEGPEAGYNVFGSLLRQGPSPFIARVLKPDDYEQAVLKFMAGDKVGRQVAQGEMDAYLRNPADWQYNRVNGYAVDYSTLKPQEVVLTLAWSAIVLSLVARGIYSLETGDNFWAILGLKSKVAECAQSGWCVLGEDQLTR